MCVCGGGGGGGSNVNLACRLELKCFHNKFIHKVFISFVCVLMTVGRILERVQIFIYVRDCIIR